MIRYKNAKDPLKKKQERDRKLDDPSEHEFVCLTEGENFLDEDCEIIDGIHHLTDS